VILTTLLGLLALAFLVDWLKQVLVLVAVVLVPVALVAVVLVPVVLVLVAVRIWDLTCITILV